jgi:hypothetical protein
MKWLLIITSFTGYVQTLHVTQEQCLAAVDVYSKHHAARVTADCFPPDAAYKVDSGAGGKSEVQLSGSARNDLPQVSRQSQK